MLCPDSSDSTLYASLKVNLQLVTRLQSSVAAAAMDTKATPLNLLRTLKAGPGI